MKALDQFHNLWSYLFAIFKAQQAEFTYRANYMQLYNYALTHLSQQPQFVITFHNLIKSLIHDKNNYQQINDILKQIGNNLQHGLTRASSTEIIRRHNFFNWIDDCLEICSLTANDNDAKLIYNFYQKILNYYLTPGLSQAPSILGKIKPLFNLTQKAETLINKNNADADDYLQALKIYYILTSARITAALSFHYEIPPYSLCGHNHLTALYDLDEYILKHLLCTTNNHTYPIYADQSLQNRLQDFIDKSQLTVKEAGFLSNIILVGAMCVANPGCNTVVDGDPQIAQSIWYKFVKYQLQQEGNNYLKAVITLTLAGNWNFTSAIKAKENIEHKEFDEVAIAQKLGFKPDKQGINESIDFIRMKGLKFFDYLQTFRIHSASTLTCWKDYYNREHKVLLRLRLRPLFKEALPEFASKSAQIKNSYQATAAESPQLIKQKLQSLRRNLIHYRHLLNKNAPLLINWYLTNDIIPQLATYCQLIKEEFGKVAAYKIEETLILHLKKFRYKHHDLINKSSRAQIATRYLAYFDKRLAPQNTNFKLLKAIR